MENVTSIEKIEYKKADNIELTFQKKFENFSRLCFASSVVLCILIQELVKKIFQLFSPSKPRNISGQLCLVSGGANGLGRALALFKVKCQGFKCDVSDTESITKMRNQVEVSMGSVDILVNNAGLLFMNPLLKCSLENIQRCVDVNLVSHFKMALQFLPGMIERRRGSIVAIASMIVQVTAPLATIYAATKYGVDGFMESLFDELCLDDYDHFIKLSTAYPYFIRTRKELTDAIDEIGDLFPGMTPEFVADQVVRGVLMNKRKIIVAPSKLILLTQKLPDRAMNYLKATTLKTRDFKQRHYK